MAEYERCIHAAAKTAECGDFDEAIALYKNAINLDPERIEAYYKIALLYFKRGEASEAIAHLEKAVALAPENNKLKREFQRFNMNKTVTVSGNFDEHNYARIKKCDALYKPSIPDNWELYRKDVAVDHRCLSKDQLLKIPTHTLSDIGLHLPLLYVWLIGIQATRVLEIGVREGHSTSALIEAMKITGGRLTSVDIIPPSGLKGASCFEFIQGTSDEVFARMIAEKRQFDVILIDGWHSYNQTKRDFENALHILNPDGYIFIHDVLNIEGCRRVYNEINGAKFDKQRAPFCNGLAIISRRNDDYLGFIGNTAVKNLAKVDTED